MTTPLTDIEKQRGMPWLVAGDTFNTGFFLLTFSGSVFILFLSELNLDEGQIGFLLALVPFGGVISPFIAPAVARFGYKRAFVSFWGLRTFAFAFMLLTPLVLARFGPAAGFIWVSTIIFAFALCRAVAETGGYPWRKEAVPDAMRGKFTAVNSIINTLAGILVTVGASLIIDSGAGLGRFMVLMSIGITFGLVSVWTYAKVPGGDPEPARPSSHSHLQGMVQALRDRNFFYFLLALGLTAIGGTAVISFVPLFMKEQVGLSEGHVVLLSIGTYLGALLSSYWWGWVADRYGSQPVMQVSLFMMLLLPVAWFLMPKHSPSSLPIAMAISFVSGVGTLAWQISWVRYLFVNAMPPEKASAYTAVYYAWFGFISGVGPLLAGQVLRLSKGLDTGLWLFRLDPYTPVFGLSVILLVTGIATVLQLRTADATPFRRLAGMFLRGNPIRALESLVQYNYAVTETSRMTVAERMGDAGNPLSTYELIEALNDPSFNVRYEAIHSIGRMPPEPELVNALLAALDEGNSELSFVITRSLGRLGNPRAVAPLRGLLDCGYHLLEASAARALAMLGDSASIPPILQKFRAEPNHVLRIAYVSALGTLGVEEAIDDIFALLRHTTNQTQRGEIGLALARMAGSETYYMQQWRNLQANPNTAAAQAVLALQKLADAAGLRRFSALCQTCAQEFAQSRQTAALDRLREILDHLRQYRLDPAADKIVAGCAACLAQDSQAHLEIILLSLHTLDCALRRLQP
jgi:MFS-type transporter involved in bile tolerance (Atg22 family)